MGDDTDSFPPLQALLTLTTWLYFLQMFKEISITCIIQAFIYLLLISLSELGIFNTRHIFMVFNINQIKNGCSRVYHFCTKYYTMHILLQLDFPLIIF